MLESLTYFQEEDFLKSYSTENESRKFFRKDKQQVSTKGKSQEKVLGSFHTIIHVLRVFDRLTSFVVNIINHTSLSVAEHKHLKIQFY